MTEPISVNGSDEPDALAELATEFWNWRRINQPISSDDLPRIERPPMWLPEWSRDSIERRRSDLAEFQNRWLSIGVEMSQSPIPRRVDYHLIGSAIARGHWELEILRPYERNPGFYVDQTLGALYLALLKPAPFDPARQADVVARVGNFERVVADARVNLRGNAVRPFALAAIEKLTDIRRRLDGVFLSLEPFLSDEANAALKQRSESAISALEDLCLWLRSSLDEMSEATSVGREEYRYFLKNVGLMPYSPEQLLWMARQEWERSVSFEAFERTRNRELPEQSLFADQTAQIERERIDEIATRRFLEDRHILTVPDWMMHYRNLPMPPYVEALRMMGVADDLTSDTRLDEDGISYIRVPSPDLDYFSLAIAKDPRPLIVHEGVPGHFFQLALSWAHENPIRRFYYDSGANEGIGFYAEELMLQFGLFDDAPRTREIMYNFMRLRALRVEVDVKLATGEFTIESAAEYLEKIAPVDRETARHEATFFAASPGQAITYQIGKLQIVKFLADARLELGDEFDLREFHDFLWKNGNVPISLLRWEFLGKSDEVSEMFSVN